MSGVGDHRRRARVSEIAGVTAADCAAVCCCCPLTVMNAMVLIIYRVPTGLCRRVKNKQRIERKKKMISNESTIKKALLQDEGDVAGFDDVAGVSAIGFDEEMWDQFRGAGFWRSPSQRES